MSGERKVLLAAGGTGGHMFPAEALARELLARGVRPSLMTDRRGAAVPAALSSIEIHRVRAGGVASGSTVKRVAGMASLLCGMLEAGRIVRRIRPDAVVGFGGYASLPAMVAATRAGVPAMIHEQNAVLGRANRMMAPRARRIATSFEKVAGVREADRSKIRFTGNPVRAEIMAVGPYEAPTMGGELRVLVFGGSLGASVFGRVVPAAVEKLDANLRKRLRIVQQCRTEDLDRVAASYRALGIEAETRTFFDDMPRRLGWAQLVLCRAGASTIAELAAAGRPALLVPYPHATDDHQTANARALEAAGGVWVMPEREMTPDSLAASLAEKLSNPVLLGTAAMALRAGARTSAARALADEVARLMDGDHPVREQAA
jgi:UDP-N-acetylglucosamine--N-acetylmuramyl-(pentapeptide) pyrophosphoryl-undecaprenol N-acetylglucosamine transferase